MTISLSDGVAAAAAIITIVCCSVFNPFGTINVTIVSHSQRGHNTNLRICTIEQIQSNKSRKFSCNALSTNPERLHFNQMNYMGEREKKSSK